ncbi:unnamed protein product [Ambrosiozyma monospora]|uniref:Unnamed protein product n=1 Tax=Ambrosiozyma monospora TaxID=43982 RepID=A0A9W6WKT8_AMBMO|nr:unnamed protein product [Ambrosiozyma monospora]
MPITATKSSNGIVNMCIVKTTINTTKSIIGVITKTQSMISNGASRTMNNTTPISFPKHISDFTFNLFTQFNIVISRIKITTGVLIADVTERVN